MIRDAVLNINSGAEVVTMPPPEVFDLIPREICRMERTASGRMVKDIVAIKREIKLKYDALTKEDFLALRAIYERGTSAEVAYREASTTSKATMYITSLPRRIVTYDTDFVRDVDVTFEEV